MKKCLIDIGTNTFGGYNKLKEILHIDDSFEKIFVEPNPEHYENIKRTIKNIPNSIYIEAAIAPYSGDCELITRDDMSGDSAATILSLEFITNSIGSVNQIIPSYNKYTVDGITIDELLSKTDADELYIKIDAEGAEFFILEDFPIQYIPKIKRLFCEFHCHNEEMRDNRDYLIRKFNSLGVNIENWD